MSNRKMAVGFVSDDLWCDLTDILVNALSCYICIKMPILLATNIRLLISGYSVCATTNAQTTTVELD